jgi:hypothetical protein
MKLIKQAGSNFGVICLMYKHQQFSVCIINGDEGEEGRKLVEPNKTTITWASKKIDYRKNTQPGTIDDHRIKSKYYPQQTHKNRLFSIYSATVSTSTYLEIKPNK